MPQADQHQSTPENESPEARLDLDRSQRINLPEAVYCAGKTVAQCLAIVEQFLQEGSDAVVATRATKEQQLALLDLKPDAHVAGTLTWRHRPSTGAGVSMAAAGTSDLPVVREAQLTLAALGHETRLITDIGVAGLHRLTNAVSEFEGADVVIAAAGFEGALPTVLAGLIPQPLIAIPTSVGYGSSFEGITALLGMLSSCAPGISVVGIDNGYGAACAAHRILTTRRTHTE